MIDHLLLLFGFDFKLHLPDQLEEIMDPITDVLLYVLQLHEVVEGDDIVLVKDPLLAVGLGDLD